MAKGADGTAPEHFELMKLLAWLTLGSLCGILVAWAALRR